MMTDNPRGSAKDAIEALKLVSESLPNMIDPQDIAPILTELVALSRTAGEVAAKLAGTLSTHHGTATDKAGDPRAGRHLAADATDQAQLASSLIERAGDALEVGAEAAREIAWPRPDGQAGHWVNIVFLQGEEAFELIDRIPSSGTDSIIQHLAGYDSGTDTVDEALENGYVYDRPPASFHDLTAAHDVYLLRYNPFQGYLGLYRQEDAFPAPSVLGLSGPQHAAPSGVSAGAVVALAHEASRRERLGNPDLETGDDAGPAQGWGRGL